MAYMNIFDDAMGREVQGMVYEESLEMGKSSSELLSQSVSETRYKKDSCVLFFH